MIQESNADFIILGGDFNADPTVNAMETTLPDITDVMDSDIEECNDFNISNLT